MGDKYGTPIRARLGRPRSVGVPTPKGMRVEITNIDGTKEYKTVRRVKFLDTTVVREA